MYLLCIMYVYMFMVLNLFIARVWTITFATLNLCLSFLPYIFWPPVTQLKSHKYLQVEEPRYQTEPSLVNRDIFQSQSSLIARIVLQTYASCPPKVLLLCRSWGGLCTSQNPEAMPGGAFRLQEGFTMLERLWGRGQTKCSTLLMLATSVFGQI